MHRSRQLSLLTIHCVFKKNIYIFSAYFRLRILFQIIRSCTSFRAFCEIDKDVVSSPGCHKTDASRIGSAVVRFFVLVFKLRIVQSTQFEIEMKYQIVVESQKNAVASLLNEGRNVKCQNSNSFVFFFAVTMCKNSSVIGLLKK